MKKKPLSKRHELIARLPYVLLKLLIERKALSAYVEATLYHYKTISMDMEDLFCAKRRDILILSFLWKYSKNGQFFWDSLNVEYNERLYRELRRTDGYTL